MELKAKLFCDDVRREIGNKLTVVGVYNDAIVFPGGTGKKVALPKLAAVFIITGLEGLSDFEYRHWFKFGDVPDPEVPWARENHNPQTSDHNFINQISPAVFPGNGTFSSSLSVRQDERVYTFDVSIDIRFLTPHEAKQSTTLN